MNGQATWLSFAATVLIGIGLCSCAESERPKREVPEYPIERSITNSQGSELDVTILGRSDTELIFVKPNNKKRYRYPIEDLSLKDRVFANKLPVAEPPPPKKEIPELDEVRIAGLEKEIHRQERRLEDMARELQDPSMRNNPTRQRSVESRMRETQMEIGELTTELRLLRGQKIDTRPRGRRPAVPRTKPNR